MLSPRPIYNLRHSLILSILSILICPNNKSASSLEIDFTFIIYIKLIPYEDEEGDALNLENKLEKDGFVELFL